jgi:hypothetical protein
VVFEILSPGNRLAEMARKLQFYDRYGVEEYYVYDPDLNELGGFIRQTGQLTGIEPIHNWVSPRLGITFVLTPTTLEIYTPQGDRFRTTLELAEQLNQAQLQVNVEQQRAEQERLRAETLANQLRSLGIEPEG